MSMILAATGAVAARARDALKFQEIDANVLPRAGAAGGLPLKEQDQLTG